MAQLYLLYLYQGHQNLQFREAKHPWLFPEAKALAFASLVRPHLGYAASAWDPYLAKEQSQLDNVQWCYAHFARNEYRISQSIACLLDDLNWPLLSVNRANCRLAAFYKAVNNLCAISANHFLQKPSITTRHSKETIFITTFLAYQYPPILVLTSHQSC